MVLPAVLWKKNLCPVGGLSALPLSLHSPQAGNAFGGAPIPAAPGDAMMVLNCIFLMQSL